MGRDANTNTVPSSENDEPVGSFTLPRYDCVVTLRETPMNEYWLMLCFVSLGAAFAWAFFRQLARLAIWSSRPKLDAWRYSLITACLAIVIGNTFELWEAALMGGVSLVAFRVIRLKRVRYEAAMQELAVHAQRRSSGRDVNHHVGS